MTLDESVEYFHSLLKFGIRPGLDSIRALMSRLGNPQDKLKYIHIAGTNGKGSTAVMLSEIFIQAGYKTGLYISPYITEFRERIQINGELVAPDVLCSAAEKVKNAADRLSEQKITITEFEAVTAAAFLCFLQEKCDIVILETGLGGRFDATNLISAPEVSVITSVSYDHTAVLGNTLEKIAFEKCGIIKQNRPTVVPASLPKEAMEVVRSVCRERNSPLTEVEPSEISVSDETLSGFNEDFGGLHFHVSISGKAQSENAALAVTAAKKAENFLISDTAIINGIKNAKNPARIELMRENPPIILDGSHNDASTKNLAEFLARHLPRKKILAVIGMMADKAIDDVLSNLLPLFSHVITTTPSNPRAIKAAELAEKIRTHGASAEAMEDPREAIKAAAELIGKHDALVVCGSLYLAGDVRNFLRNIAESDSYIKYSG